jgi:type IV pilus assembly protein PilC
LIDLNNVGNKVFQSIIERTTEDVKGGSSVSDAFGKHEEFREFLFRWLRLEKKQTAGNILKTLSNFYRREVTNAIDSLVSLIEPAMIVLLGLGVAFLMAAVLVPIYSISSGM